MSKTVRDILIDVGSGDLKFTTGEMGNGTVFNIVWGRLFDSDGFDVLYANIVIPTRKIQKLEADDDGRYLIYAKAAYFPALREFTVRLVEITTNKRYQEIDQESCTFPVLSYAYNQTGERRLNACELPGINVDGNYAFVFEFGDEDNTARVYTADRTDFYIGGSDIQSAHLLAICDAGKYYRYPTTGIGTTNFIGSVVAHTELGDKITKQHQDNNIPVQEAEFDASTGELQVIFFNEGIKDDENLLDVDDLDMDGMDVTDEVLYEISSEIDITDYVDMYDTDFLNVNVLSCYANGVWIGSYPWTSDNFWRDEQ